MNTREFIKALDVLENERGISKTIVLDALAEALEKSYKRIYCEGEADVRVQINETKGKIRLYLVKTVVEDVEEGFEDLQIAYKDLPVTKKKYAIGDEYEIEVDPDIFSRLAASQTKQILRQKIREIEKETMFEEYISKKDELITGQIDRVEERFAIINIGKTGALLPANQQISNEKLVEGQYIKVYVSAVEKGTKGAQVLVSRTDPGLVKRLFEQEVPEVFDGTVEIKSVARDAGDRSKMAVFAKNSDVDAIGACVGNRGSRVNTIVNELHGEKIDIVEWSNDPIVYISNALSPSQVVNVTVNEDTHSAQVVVPDNQLSLAIGKRGQNARLAVGLTGWKIDIKSFSDAMAEGLFDPTVSEKQAPIEEEFVNEEVVEEIVVEAVTPVTEIVPAATPKKEEKVDVSSVLATVRKEKYKAEKAKKPTKSKKTKNNDDDDYFFNINNVEEVKSEKSKPVYSMPIYDDDEEEIEIVEDLSKYEDDIDYDEFDKYYDED